MQRLQSSTLRLVTCAALTAIAVVLNFIPGFPMVPGVSFIHYEYSDIAVVLAAMLYGPLSGLAVAFLSVLLSFLLSFEAGAYIGAIMHFAAIATYAVTVGLIYRPKKETTNILLALIAGTIAMTAVMIPCNLWLTPIYLRDFAGVPGATVDMVTPYIFPAIIPANCIKGVITAVVTFIAAPYLKRAIVDRAAKA